MKSVTRRWSNAPDNIGFQNDTFLPHTRSEFSADSRLAGSASTSNDKKWELKKRLSIVTRGADGKRARGINVFLNFVDTTAGTDIKQGVDLLSPLRES